MARKGNDAVHFIDWLRGKKRAEPIIRTAEMTACRESAISTCLEK